MRVCVLYTIPSPFNSPLLLCACLCCLARTALSSALKPTPTRRRCQTLRFFFFFILSSSLPFFPSSSTIQHTHTHAFHTRSSSTDWQAELRENHNGTQAGNDTHTQKDEACHSCCCHFLFFCCWLLTRLLVGINGVFLIYPFRISESNNRRVESNEIANNNSVGIFSKN